ncbi:MAG: ribosome-associated translation inhibitor RaiA [Chlamydiota bacterium]|jgi:putative sigma-54 modulation protein
MSQNAEKTRLEKFAFEGYSLAITGNHIVLTDPIRDYALEKVSKIERFSDQILDVVVTLDVVKLAHVCTIDLMVKNFKIRAHASMDDIYSAIDKASARLMRLVKKYKSRLEEKHAIDPHFIDLKVNVFRPAEDNLKEINDEIEAENIRRQQEKYAFHKIVSKETHPLHLLTQQEAIMRMELSGDSFMIYKGEEDQKLKVIYRRKEDDHFGVIEIE